MADQRAVHEGLPLRIEEFPRTGVAGFRGPRDARALRVSDAALEIVAAHPESQGAVLRVRASEPISPTGACDLVARVIQSHSRRDGQHRIALTILGIDRQENLQAGETTRDARYPVSVAT